MIDWNIKKNRRRFQEALQKAYIDYDRLEMFMDNYMDQPLREITPEAALDIVAFKIVKWAEEKNLIVELFQEFCDAHPRLKDAVIADLQNQPLVPQSTQLPELKVPAPEPKPSSTVATHGYLLVTLDDAYYPKLNVYAELHITGRDFPIDFGAEPTTCLFDEVATKLSKWIQMAEETIAAEGVDEAEVTLEVFLPCRYLEEEIETTWRICDRRGSEFEFGVHRRFVVRSFDRIDHQPTQQSLKNTWSQLQICVKDDDACRQFHTQIICPEKPGILKAILQEKRATGLKFVAAFPQNASDRKGLLYEIIDAGIPIALWSSEEMDADSTTIEAEFDQLLSASQVTNFGSLAGQWRMRRVNSSRSSPMRLLCDRPDRVPKLPDPSQEDDLLVAS